MKMNAKEEVAIPAEIRMAHLNALATKATICLQLQPLAMVSVNICIIIMYSKGFKLVDDNFILLL